MLEIAWASELELSMPFRVLVPRGDARPVEGLVTVCLGGMTMSAPPKERLEGLVARKAKGAVSKVVEEPLEGLSAFVASGCIVCAS